MYYIKEKGTDNIIEAIDRVLSLQENIASILTFKLLPNNNFLNRIEKFVTELEVFNDDLKVFTGRVIDISDSMKEDGSLEYNITAESALNFLNDTRVGKWDIHPGAKPPDEELKDSIIYENMSVRKVLELILDNHNSKVKENRKIFLGNVDVDENVFCYTNRETSLNVIQTKIVQRKGGFLNIREVNGKYYLDYLKGVDLADNVIELGINLRSISRQSNLNSIITRLIPIGNNDISIKSVNNGIEYIEDIELIKKYGVIESVHKWDDVTLPENLLKKANEKLKEINKNTYSITLSALELALISQDFEEFKISQHCLINNILLNIKDKHRIIAKKINMENPTLSNITLSNDPPSAINNSTGIRQEIDDTKIELLITDKKISSKISQGEFESYQEQVAEGFKKTVKKGTEFESEVLLASDKYQISMNGKLGGKTYTFDGTSFRLGGTDSGNTVEHTNDYSKWTHANGHYSIATANGFNRVTPSGTTNYQYITFNTRIAKIRNGYWTTVKLPDQFKNKRINQDFQLFVMTGDIDADAYVVGSRRGALRNIFAQWQNWNSTEGTLQVRPCLQKIGLDTGSLFGWDSSTTSQGATPNEGAIDIVVFAQM